MDSYVLGVQEQDKITLATSDLTGKYAPFPELNIDSEPYQE
jgi:hypothetical protein